MIIYNSRCLFFFELGLIILILSFRALPCEQVAPDNLESFKDDKIKRNNHKATKKYIEILIETIDNSPQEL